jgi:hypothetical protein
MKIGDVDENRVNGWDRVGGVLAQRSREFSSPAMHLVADWKHSGFREATNEVTSAIPKASQGALCEFLPGRSRPGPSSKDDGRCPTAGSSHVARITT